MATSASRAAAKSPAVHRVEREFDMDAIRAERKRREQQRASEHAAAKEKALRRLMDMDDTPPPGAFCVNDVAKELGVDRSTANRRLKKMTEDGILKRMRFQHVFYYWFPDQEEQT